MSRVGRATIGTGCDWNLFRRSSGLMYRARSSYFPLPISAQRRCFFVARPAPAVRQPVQLLWRAGAEIYADECARREAAFLRATVTTNV